MPIPDYDDFEEEDEGPSRWVRIKQWFWNLLPDKCQVPGCCRQGTRGNENIIDGKIVCDYCDAASWSRGKK